MDTDDFSDMAYAIIVQAARVSDTLKAELGATSRDHRHEDDWLRGTQKHLRGIQAHPQDYVGLWSLDEFEGVDPAQIRELATRLLDQIPEILATPLEKRGHREPGMVTGPCQFPDPENDGQQQIQALQTTKEFVA